jgi:hypothetical protein
MTTTPHLDLPFIEGSQAQKHVTHNEALRILDAVVQIGVHDADRTAPPSSPAVGDRHIVASGATGAWAGQAGAIALYDDGGWRFFMPKAGWCAWSAADGALLVYDGTAWGEVAGGGGGGGMGDSVAKLGINDTATAPNLLTVRSGSALFHAVPAADGGSGDIRLQISKDGAANTASVFFSDAYAGRAEFGLTGDNDFHLKVSADGTTWRDALKFDRTTGRASFPSGGAREMLTADRTYYVRTDGNDGNAGFSNTAGGAFKTVQRAYDVIAATLDLGGFAVTIQLADGTYAPPSGTSVLGIAQPWTGGGSVTVQGNAAAPANVVLSATAADAVRVTSPLPGNLTVKDVKLQTATSGDAIIHMATGTLRFGNVNFGATARCHITTQAAGAIITAISNYVISGGGAYHGLATNPSSIKVSGVVVTLSGTPAFGVFAQASGCAIMDWSGTTFSGAATGQRYSLAINGVIYTGTGNASFFPGSTAGTAGSGGQYL